jgi:formylglycine-generating enzyme required for sulfatase activity
MQTSNGIRRGLAVAVLCALIASVAASQPSSPQFAGMVHVPGGEFWMGLDDDDEMFAYAKPLHLVRVQGFWIDRTEVTNAHFGRFVAATGYRTIAERPLDPKDFPGVPAEQLQPAAAVFSAPAPSTDLADAAQWWRLTPGANWRHPEGPGSSIAGRMDHPVVQIAYDDALACAKWAGKRLPTEAEWEYAARGGLDRKVYAWGDVFAPGGRHQANSFQGRYPDRNTRADGHAGTAPVRAFPPNGYGLYGVAGNAWEWVSDWYRADYYQQLSRSGKTVANPLGPDTSFDPAEPGVAKRLQKGGSYL